MSVAHVGRAHEPHAPSIIATQASSAIAMVSDYCGMFDEPVADLS